MTTSAYGEKAVWGLARPRVSLLRLLVSWVLATASLLVAAWIVPGADVHSFWGAFVAAAVIAVLNAIVPPVIAALRLPLTLVLGLLLVLVADALMLLAADAITDGDLSVDSFWSALGVAFVASAVSVVLDVVFGTNDDDAYTLRVIQRIARRSGERVETDAPGVVFLEIDGLALPVLQRAMRDGNAPTMARWLVEGGYALTEWETDLSSQTGASQAGILLGSNEDIPAFRWVEKETATMMTCSAPPDCAEIERRHAGHGLLRDGGASRGNLLSGEADHVILTVSRMEEEKRANPGYRAFLANGFNVTRVLVLLFWEVMLELSASSRAKRRDVRPRGPPWRHLPAHARRALRLRSRPDRLRRAPGHDEGPPCDLRDVLELRRGRTPLRSRARRHARGAAQARPAVRTDRAGATVRIAAVRDRRPLRPRPDAGGDVQAAQRLRPRRARRAVALPRERRRHRRRRRAELDGRPCRRARRPGESAGEGEEEQKNDVSDRDVVVMGSGNLGLVYLMEERRRLTLEEMDERHPELIPALRSHPHIGWLLVRSSEHGPVALGGERSALPRRRPGRG